MNNPLSPVTGQNNTTLTDIFFSKDIIKLYKDQLGLDVSGFFSGYHSFFLYQCSETGYRFFHPKGIDGDGNFFATLQQRLGDDYYHDWKFENQLAYEVINAGDKVLDIGCGVGKFLEKIKPKACEVSGLELNESAITICKQKGLRVNNEKIKEHAAKWPGHYDAVCMFQVLEHIYDVKPFLEDSLKTLKKGGKLVIGVPNNEPYFQYFNKYSMLNLPPHNMGLWNKEVFERMAKVFNLKMQEVQYDVKGSIKTYAYLKAKYMAHVKSPAGRHTNGEKIKMLTYGLITFPAAIIKKITKGIHGSHIAIVFEKN